MININKIQKLAEENCYLTSILKEFTKYRAEDTLTNELLKIYFLASKVAKLGDDIYYEFIKTKD